MEEPLILTVDRGNTRVKVSLCRGMRPLDVLVLPEFRIADVEDFCLGRDLKGVVCCSVGKPFGPGFISLLEDRLGVPVVNLDHSLPLPIGVDYATPATLGLDRVAAAAGASALFPGRAVLVADAGTALTLDVTDSDTVFRGGNISPGLSMRLRAMHEFTVSLPRVDVDGAVPLFGYDTATAMRSGSVRGMASEIRGAFEYAAHDFGVTDLLLCGGDAPTLLPFVGIPESSLHLVSGLVEAGLVSIFNYNVSL